MYSVVLMAALTTTTADAPSFGFLRHGCHGGWGACGGCYGGCNGCYGGCNGCYGGCYGGGWGCHGGARYGCHGCNGCYGGCYGNCHGGTYVGCFGGCHGCNGYGPTGVVAPPSAAPGREPLMKPAPDKATSPPAPKSETSLGNGAKLIVDLPADAKLYIDDKPIKVTSQHPIFATPNLEYGKTYYYELRAEMIKDGKTLTDSKRVVFHAGDELRESFTALASTPEKGTANTEKVAAGTSK